MNRTENGFTMIELLVSLGIMALVAYGASIAMMQIFPVNARNNAHMTAVNEVQNAGYWVSRDAQMASNITTNLTPYFLVLSWAGNETTNTSSNYSVTYTTQNMTGSNFMKLLRSLSINGGANRTTLVAQYIDMASTKCAFSGGVFTLNVTANVSSRYPSGTETRTYKVTPRPN